MKETCSTCFLRTTLYNHRGVTVWLVLAVGQVFEVVGVVAAVGVIFLRVCYDQTQCSIRL